MGWGVWIKEVVGTGIWVWGWSIFISFACSGVTILVTGTWTYLVTNLGSILVTILCSYLVTTWVAGALTAWYVTGVGAATSW